MNESSQYMAMPSVVQSNEEGGMLVQEKSTSKLNISIVLVVARNLLYKIYSMDKAHERSKQIKLLKEKKNASVILGFVKCVLSSS